MKNFKVLTVGAILFMNCNNLVYHEKIIVLEKDCNKQHVELYSNHSMVYNDTLIINASVAMRSFKLLNDKPLVILKMNGDEVFNEQISKNTRSIIFRCYDPISKSIRYEFTNQMLRYD